jgi:histidinol-phosphate/aromatic aminotransferase/cobyric acid decarboxylase-like protein
MHVNSLLAAKNFGVHEENILVGNGAAEIIKSLMNDFSGKAGIIRPTFEEYGQRYGEENLVVYWPENDDFQYDEQDMMDFFGDKDIQNLILINPDNPSGNYIPKEKLLRLIKWTKDKGIKFLVDESFVDFTDEKDSSIIEQEILSNNPHLYIMKSISKSYGVPGLRLGVLASGDVETIAKMKKDVAIWNINSFAEFYMQIEEKYKKNYDEALKKFRAERQRYVKELSKINGIRVIPSQANYVMAEVTTGMTAKELNRRLIVKHNILIKNLAAKIHQNGKQYVRLAVKMKEENDKLIEALKDELTSHSDY